MDTPERRVAAELRASQSGRLEGYAAVFGVSSHDLGGFREIVRSGAFARSLKSSGHVRALYDHDGRSVLGRVGAGTLRLAEDTRGLHFEIDLPPTTVGKDLAVLVERGDVAGASFAFRVPPNGDEWRNTDSGIVRELLDVDLHEITVTADPAYPDTTVAKRHIPLLHRRLALALRYLETCR
ncbi:MAG: HK97 family phage prohead protease [Gammaproteobacteria bacterium]|nr:HK97 family phage prohead protease [Gammaproteobacteria bacterium]